MHADLKSAWVRVHPRPQQAFQGGRAINHGFGGNQVSELSGFSEHILKLDHTAHAVHSIREASRLYRDILGGVYIFGGDVEEGGFRFEQYRYPNGSKIELIEPLNADSSEVSQETWRGAASFDVQSSSSGGTGREAEEARLQDCWGKLRAFLLERGFHFSSKRSWNRHSTGRVRSP